MGRLAGMTTVDARRRREKAARAASEPTKAETTCYNTVVRVLNTLPPAAALAVVERLGRSIREFITHNAGS